MIEIAALIAPIFIIIAVGYAAVRFGLFVKSDIRAISALVINFALPALIFKSLSQRAISDILNVRYLLIYGVASLVVYALVLFVARGLWKRPLPMAAMQALGASLSNSGFIGYPVLALIMPQTAPVALALCMMVEIIVVIPMSLALAEGGTQVGASRWTIFRASLARLVKNPLMIAIAFGMLFSLAKIPLPGPFIKAVDMMAMASGAAALFVIGGTLVGLKLGGMMRDVALVVAGKLVLHPVLMLAGLLLFPGLAPDLAKAALIMASVSMFTIYPLLSQRFGQEDMAAAALMVATTLSFFTLTLALYFADGLLVR